MCGSSAAVLSSLSPAWTMVIAAATAASRRIRANDRYADDVHINREMREVERWNDPASEFLTVTTSLTYHPTATPGSKHDGKADMRRKRRRTEDLDDLNIMVLVLPIDSISYRDSDGMELVSPSPLSNPAPLHLVRLALDLIRLKSKLISDRSNGFEKKYFQHQNTVARRTYQADQMGMEDM